MARGRFLFLVIPIRYVIACSILLLTLGGLVFYSYYPVAILTSTLSRSEIRYDVMLDAGHGGIDPGGIGAGNVYEKHINLDIVLHMKELLEAKGLKVGLTRGGDTDVSHLVEQGTRHRRDLLGRYGLMHTAKIGLSVHVNTSKAPEAQGALILYMENSYLGKQYAQALFDQIERVQVMNHRSVVPKSNLLLLKAKNPVVLVELGFLTNKHDLAKLTDPQFRKNVAQALSEGVLRFLAIYEAEQTE